jgi:hypothetical protein
VRGAPAIEAAEPRWAESTIVANDDDGTVTIALVMPERPWTLNEAKRMHFMVERKKIQFWRSTFTAMADQCPRLAWAELRIWHEVGRRIIPDPAACALAVKAALDGCVDHVEEDGTVRRGILPDDGGEFIRRHIYEPPYYSGRYAVTLEFTGPLE